MAERDIKIIRLTDERLRRLERRMQSVEGTQKGTNVRLDQAHARLEEAVDVLTRLVHVVKAQNDKINRNFAHIGERLDRLSRAILQARTRDSQRMTRTERRLETAERRLAQLERS